jgi:prolyl-tRNA synthetase
MGGSASEEFLAVSASGEDTFVRATDGDYAANVEAVITPAPAERPIDGQPEAKVYDTPDATTMDTLLDWARSEGLEVDGRPAELTDTLKCLVVKITEPGGEPELTGVLLPGDREADMKRLEASLEPAVVELASDEDFAKNPFLVKGYVGPKGLADNGIKVLADPRVVNGTAWITGADAKNRHVANMVAGRDFTVDGFIEAAEIREGDAAPDGMGTLTLERGIEIGHIFQLGRKYTEAFDVKILDESGKRSVPTMGSYGLGVSRLIAVLAEQMHDDKGLRWPTTVAPFDVHVVIANKDAAAGEAAESLASELDAAGLEVIFDERPKVGPGVKFKDAELLGMPLVVIVGRGFAEGTVELRNRLTGETTNIVYGDAVATIRELAGK